MSRQAESRLSRKIVLRLMELGFQKAWKNHGDAFSEAGLSDVMGIKDGTFVAIEVKLDTAVTELQQRFLDKLNEGGAVAFEARSVKEVEEVLRERGVIA